MHYGITHCTGVLHHQLQHLPPPLLSFMGGQDRCWPPCPCHDPSVGVGLPSPAPWTSSHCVASGTYPESMGDLQDPTDWRYLPYIRPMSGLCKGISPGKYGQTYGTNVPPSVGSWRSPHPTPGGAAATDRARSPATVRCLSSRDQRPSGNALGHCCIPELLSLSAFRHLLHSTCMYIYLWV